MDITTAQSDVRRAFASGFAGQLVSALIWAASAACSTWHSHKLGIQVLVIAGFFIFPLTQLALKTMGRPGTLPKGHPMNALAMQVAFILPLSLPLVAAATLFRHSWFYPAFMLALGTHYLPFIFLYGMWQFGILAAGLISVAMLIAHLHVPFALGAWICAAMLMLMSCTGWIVSQREARSHVLPR